MAEGSRSRQEVNVSFTTLGSTYTGVTEAMSNGNTSHVEWSALTTELDGRAGRNTNSRSRNQPSVRADSFRRSEGRRMSQDTRRYMQAAAASTQTTVQQLLTRLQSYKTFKTLLSHQVTYTPSVEEGRGRMMSAGSMARRQSTVDRTLTSPQLWQMMNSLLDTSVSHLLQHSSEEHFIVTLQSALGRELTTSAPKVRTVIESRSSSIAAPKPGGGGSSSAGLPSAPLTTSIRRTSTVHTNDSNILADRWAAEHPNATAAEVSVQRNAWSAFDEKRRRENRSFYLKAMQEQLDALQAEENGQSPHPGTPQFADNSSRALASRLTSVYEPWMATNTGRVLDRSSSGATMLGEVCVAESEEELKKEAERQRALWLSFQDKPSASAVVATAAGAGGVGEAGVNSAKYGVQLSPDAPRIVTDYLESTDLHSWLHSSWAHRTHRHESAALRIQCAYRAYRARCEVCVMRYARRQSFVVGLAAEKEARRVWDVALQVQADASKAGNNNSTSGSGTNTSNGDDTMRALQYFIDKINAVVAKRRARKRVQQEQDAEVRAYAAVSVQRVYRGHRARVYVEELRHPEIVQARQRVLEEKAASAIQTSWRRHRAEQQWHSIRRAACTLQQAYRCRAARRLLAQRRRLRALEEEVELRRFAVHRIEVWYGRHLARRSAFVAVHRMEMHTLQRVSRGYLARRDLGAELRTAALRVAAAVVDRRRRALLDARAAMKTRAMLAETKAAEHRTALCGDAAITIQRAWRSRRAAATVVGSDDTEL